MASSEISVQQRLEQLRQDIVQEARKVLKELTGSDQLETIYFTSFVMQ